MASVALVICIFFFTKLLAVQSDKAASPKFSSQTVRAQFDALEKECARFEAQEYPVMFAWFQKGHFGDFPADSIKAELELLYAQTSQMSAELAQISKTVESESESNNRAHWQNSVNKYGEKITGWTEALRQMAFLMEFRELTNQYKAREAVLTELDQKLANGTKVPKGELQVLAQKCDQLRQSTLAHLAKLRTLNQQSELLRAHSVEAQINAFLQNDERILAGFAQLIAQMDNQQSTVKNDNGNVEAEFMEAYKELVNRSEVAESSLARVELLFKYSVLDAKELEEMDRQLNQLKKDTVTFSNRFNVVATNFDANAWKRYQMEVAKLVHKIEGTHLRLARLREAAQNKQNERKRESSPPPRKETSPPPRAQTRKETSPPPRAQQRKETSPPRFAAPSPPKGPVVLPNCSLRCVVVAVRGTGLAPKTNKLIDCAVKVLEWDQMGVRIPTPNARKLLLILHTDKYKFRFETNEMVDAFMNGRNYGRKVVQILTEANNENKALAANDKFKCTFE